MTSVLAVAAGGAIGSVGRWGLGILLSSCLPGLPGAGGGLFGPAGGARQKNPAGFRLLPLDKRTDVS